MTLAAILLAILGGAGRSEPKVVVCSVIELNHRYDELGQHCYSQIILWQWSETYHRHDVAEWWLVEPARLDALPRRVGDTWRVDHVSNMGRRYQVRSQVYRETSTITDPERDNKLLRSEEHRARFVR